MENFLPYTEDLSPDERIVAEELRILSTKQFVTLTIFSFGIYELWWMYKAWRFFKEKDEQDIMPAARALFSFIFMIPLFNRILDFARSRGYTESYNSVVLYLVIIIFNIAARFHDALIVLALSTCIFFIPVVKTFNFAILNSPEYHAQEQTSFNSRQKTLLVFGTLFWIMFILSFVYLQKESV